MFGPAVQSGRISDIDSLGGDRSVQVYAGLRRLGYTVQRTPRFLPPRFRKQPGVNETISTSSGDDKGTAVNSVSLGRRFMAICRSWATGLLNLPGSVWGRIVGIVRGLVAFVTGRSKTGSRGLLDGHGASNYGEHRRVGNISARQRADESVTHSTGALYEKLRIIPAGHSHPVTNTSITSTQSDLLETPVTDLYAPLVDNPYLPFFHVWKPATHWTMGKWDKASEEGLKANPPAFWIGVVE